MTSNTQRPKRRSVTAVGLSLALLAASAVTLAPTAALAVQADEALPEWSGTVLGGDQLTFPPTERLLDFDKVATGSNFSIGIDTDGDVWGWGINGYGMLGNTEHFGYYRFAPYPAPLYDVIGEQARAIDVGAGANYSIVLDSDGTAWSYGANTWGQLGNPKDARTGESHVVPLPVVDSTESPLTFASVTAGSYSGYGTDTDGLVWAWGRHGSGELGNVGFPVTAFAYSAVALPLRDAAGDQMELSQIATGEEFAVGLDSDNKAWGWGRGNRGQLGTSTTSSTQAIPIAVTDEHGTQLSFREVSAGREYALGLDDQGRAWSWGNNVSGQLGNPGVTGISATPVPVVDENGAQQRFAHISAGMQTGYGIRADNTVHAWGQNSQGQLGDPALTPVIAPWRSYAAPVLNSSGVGFLAQNIAAGDRFVFGIEPTSPSGRSQAWAWGTNEFGQLGNAAYPSGTSDDFRSVPVEVSLPQPTAETRLYLGDDDLVGITGEVDGERVTFTLPAHVAGKVPLFVSWSGDGVLREPAGFYTFMLDPVLTVAPQSALVGDSAAVTIAVPAAELPYLGDSVVDIELADDLVSESAIPDVFDGAGSLTFNVSAETAENYDITGRAVVRDAGEADVVVSPELSGIASFATEAIVPPVKPLPPVTVPTPPAQPGGSGTGLAVTGASQSPVGAVLLIMVGAAVLAGRRFVFGRKR